MVTLKFSDALVKQLREEQSRAIRLNNVRLYKITQGLLWIHEKKSLVAIAQLLQVSVKTVGNWLRRLMIRGVGWLQTHHYQGRGRKAKLTDHQKQALYAKVVAGPEANGFDSGLWNSAMIEELIWRCWGVHYNPRYLTRGAFPKSGTELTPPLMLSAKKQVALWV